MTGRPVLALLVADATTRRVRSVLDARLGTSRPASTARTAPAPVTWAPVASGPAAPAGGAPDAVAASVPAVSHPAASEPAAAEPALSAPVARAPVARASAVPAHRRIAAEVRGALSPSGPADAWTRTNHRGDPVSLLEGPAVAAGLLAGSMLGAGGLRAAAAATVATAGGAAFGLVDDLAEDPADRAKGLRGHLAALARGRVTTGGLKLLGIGATGLLAAAVATPTSGERAAATAPRRVADVVASGALLAGCANLVNLLDLRPGRALKAAGLVALPLTLAGGRGAGAAGAVLGAAAGALRADLAGRDMLGDGGANALGALLGTAVVLDAPRPVRLTVLGGVVALTLASERVSFTQVIANHSLLRELDEWGRPAGAGAGAAPAAVATGETVVAGQPRA